MSAGADAAPTEWAADALIIAEAGGVGVEGASSQVLPSVGEGGEKVRGSEERQGEEKERDTGGDGQGGPEKGKEREGGDSLPAVGLAAAMRQYGQQ